MQGYLEMVCLIFTPRQNEGYCHHNVCLSVVCEHFLVNTKSSKSYPILMKLHRIVPWGVRMNPIEFRNDDVISDVISGKSALLACKHSNSSKSYPISMKLHRIVP